MTSVARCNLAGCSDDLPLPVVNQDGYLTARAAPFAISSKSSQDFPATN
jgi:hypothetical protein